MPSITSAGWLYIDLIDESSSRRVARLSIIICAQWGSCVDWHMAYAHASEWSNITAECKQRWYSVNGGAIDDAAAEPSRGVRTRSYSDLRHIEHTKDRHFTIGLVLIRRVSSLIYQGKTSNPFVFPICVPISLFCVPLFPICVPISLFW